MWWRISHIMVSAYQGQADDESVIALCAADVLSAALDAGTAIGTIIVFFW